MNLYKVQEIEHTPGLLIPNERSQNTELGYDMMISNFTKYIKRNGL